MASPIALAALQIVLWHSYHGAEQRGLEAAVQRWNQLHPDRAVDPRAFPADGFQQKLEAAIPHGNGPDAFIRAHEATGEWVRAGLVVPVTDGVSAGEYLPGTIEPLQIGGQTYGVPLAFKSVALFYRTDLVRAPPASTDELLADCAALPAQPGRFCLAYEAGSFFHHAAWVHGHGGRILDGDRVELASPGGIAALAFVRSLAERHLIPDETTGTVVSELFNDGRAAFAINGPWFLGDVRPGVPFAVAPLPRVSSTGRPAAPLLTIEAGFLPARAAHPAEALEFLRWLAGPDGSLLRAQRGQQPVCSRAAWDDPAIAGDPHLAAFRAQLASTVPMSNSPSMQAVWEPAQQALRRVLRGAWDPAAALREADRGVAITLAPPPPASSPLPLLVVLGALGIGGAFWLSRRARAAGPGASLPGNVAGAGAWAYLGPAVLAMVVLVFIPFAVGVGMSVCHFDGVGWRYIGFANFTSILGARDHNLTDPLSFYFTLVVTALWTVANVTLHVLIGVTLALLLRDPLLRLRAFYRVALIVPWAIPNYITALIWKGMFHRQFGAINGLLKLLGLEPVAWFSQFSTAFAANVATNVWLGFPFMMVVTLGALSRIPRELEEAAALDGASGWQRLRHVILPLLRPALLPSVILGAVWTFNMFNVVFLVSGGEPDGATDILISQAYRWAFTRGHRYGYAAAYAVLIFLVLVAQMLVGQRATRREEQ